MTPERAIAFIQHADEVPGWSGDVAVGFPFDPKARSYSYPDGSRALAKPSPQPTWVGSGRAKCGSSARCPLRQDLPVRRVSVDALVASQPTVSREYMIELLQLAAMGALDVPPILVLPQGPVYWIQDGHHRAYAAYLLGSSTVEAWIRPSLKDCPG